MNRERQDRAGCGTRWTHAATVAAFACILALALLVRLYRIGEETLHLDESIILRGLMGLYPRDFWDAFRVSREADPPMTPVYFLAQYGWARMFGLHLVSLRLLSVLCSAASLVAAFFIGRRLGGALTGLAAMFLLAASPVHVYYSLEIRNYALTVLLGLLSVLTLLRGVERPSGRVWAANFAVDVLLGMSHLFANLLFVPQALFLLLCHRRRGVLGPWFVSHALVAVVVAAWLRTCDLGNIGTVAAYIPPLNGDVCRWMFTSVTGASYEWSDSALTGFSGIAGAAVSALFLLGLGAFLAECAMGRGSVSRGGNADGTRGMVLLFLVVFVPPALLAAMTLSGTRCFLARYAICSVSCAPVLLACAVTTLRARTLRALLCAALAAVNIALLAQILETRPQRRSWTPLRQFMGAEMKREDRLVLFSASEQFSSKLELVLSFLPDRTVRRQTWSPRDFDELTAWHARGEQVWCATDAVAGANAQFEAVLGALRLPFTRHVFRHLEQVIYRIPARPYGFVASGSSVTEAPLAGGGLRGWFVTDTVHSGVGTGMAGLVSDEYPFAPLFTRPGFGLRSVMEGGAGGIQSPWETPALSPLSVRLSQPSGAEVRWTQHTAANVLDCRMLYGFPGGRAVDLLFEVTPRATPACAGPLVFSLDSGVGGVCTPGIHFPGTRDGAGDWQSFGEDPSERGTVSGDAGTVRFAEPVFYGLVDGDHDPATAEDTMMLILMFEHPEATRFTVRDDENDPQAARWGWQYVVGAPEPGRTYSQRVRMLYMPCMGRDEVLAGYRAWRGALPAMDGVPDGEGIVWLPGPPAPCQADYDLTAPLDRLAEVSPGQALEGFRGLLAVPWYRNAAADRIDALCAGHGDPAGLVALWEGVAARGGGDALPWVRLGDALRRAGQPDRAADAFSRGLEKSDPNQDCRMGLADLYLGEGRIEEAVALCDAAVAECAELAARVSGMCAAAGNARLALGDHVGAETAARAAVRHAPGNTDAKLLLGRVLVARDDTANGLALVDEFAAALPDQAWRGADVYAAAAEARFSAGDKAGAIARYSRARALAPHNSAFTVRLGDIRAAAGDDDGALAEYRAVMRAVPESSRCGDGIDAVYLRRHDTAGRVDEWRRLVELHPGALVPRVRLGLALEAAGDAAGAEDACRTALERDPRNEEAKLLLGRLLAARGDTAASLALFDAAGSNPAMAGPAAEACAALAQERLAAGDPAGAAAALRRACALVPGACVHAFNLAAALEAAQDWAGAEAAYGDTLRCDPGHLPAKIRLAALLLARGETERGLAMTSEAVSAQPDMAGVAAEACAAAAKKCMAAGNPARAVTALRRAVELTPDATGSQFDLAAALEAAGDSVGALDVYRAVLSAVPESPRSAARIDALFDAEGDAAARVAEWKRIAAAHPDAAVPQLHLGLALEAAGDAAAARTAFETALKINPDLAEARRAFDRTDNTQGDGKH